MSTATDDVVLAEGRSELPRWFPERFTGTPRLVELSPMLVNILESLCEGGKTNRQIGADWFITEDTVKTHLKRLFAKMGARDRVHAVTLVFSGAVDIRRKLTRHDRDWSTELGDYL